MADAAEGETYEYEEFMTEWLVDVPEGRDIADEIGATQPRTSYATK